MKKRRVGSSDLHVSVAGLGCNNFGARLDAEGTDRVVARALDLGINLFDTADSYGKDGASERMLGKALGSRRKDAVIATKFGWPLDNSGTREGASRKYVFAAVEASLKRLGTDWIDLYQLHRPDPNTPIEETLEALADLKKEGKIRHAGCSNLPPALIQDAASKAGLLHAEGFVSGQHHYNLLTRQIESGEIPALRQNGMSLLPFAPLAAGLLSGKFRRDAPMPEGARVTNSPMLAERYLNPSNWNIIEQLVAFSTARDRSLLDLAFAWLVARDPVCSVIAGAMSPEQVDANVTASSWTLTESEIAEIDAITSPPAEKSKAG